MPRFALLLPSLFWTISCSAQPMTETQKTCENHPLHSALRAGEDSSVQVIVTLTRDENGEVFRLQERLLSELEGTEHEVVRRHENFPILSLRVGEDAFCRVVASPLVEAVQENVPESPAGP